MSTLSKIAVPLALCFALTACDRPVMLGNTNPDYDLKGKTTVTELFNGATAKGNHLTIKGSKLEQDKRYKFNGNVTVEGNFPSNSRLDVHHGKIVINGDVGEGARLDVKFPYDTHRESYSCLQYNAALKMHLPSTCWKTVVDGLTYPNDNDPAITVNGHVSDNVKLYSNAGIQVESVGDNLKHSTGFDRQFTTLGR